MTSILDRPVKARTFTGVSVRRRLVNVVATLLVTLSVGVALVPLIWVLYSVVAKGLGAVRSSEWWTHSQADMTAFMSGGGAYHAIVGTVLQGLVCAAISIPIGVFVAVYLVEYRGDSTLGKLTTFMVDILAGVPSIVAALVHLCAVHCHTRFPAIRFRGSAGPGAADDPGDRAVDRADAADRPGGAAGGQLCAGRAELEDDHQDRAAGRVCPASSPASCWRWPG